MSATSHPLVIVGAGLAAWTVAREFRKLDATCAIVMVTLDSGDFYAKPTLSNAYAQKRTPDQLVTTAAAKMAETLKVELHVHTHALAIDTQAQTLTIQKGAAKQTLAYGQLVLATGANPIRVPVEGDAADQVRSVNHLGDFAQFHAALGAAPKTVLVLGAGLIGCEFANDLVLGGYAVHVVDPAATALSALLPSQASAQLRDALQDLGVVWHFGTTLQSLTHSEGRMHARFANGEQVSADVVLSAIGLRADMSLAQHAGLECDRGIVVSQTLQTSAPHVYALGDCAQYASAQSRTLPYVMPIMNAARALAATLHGTDTPLVFPVMPVSVKTPALPIVLVSPSPHDLGQWTQDPTADSSLGGAWRFVDAQGHVRGFVLTGKHTSKRMEWSKDIVV
jgi:rubredoxin-NAD+ reductase